MMKGFLEVWGYISNFYLQLEQPLYEWTVIIKYNFVVLRVML